MNIPKSELCEVDMQQRSSSDIMKMSMIALKSLKLTHENREKAARIVNPNHHEYISM